jgi:hypothetical protein
MNRRDDVPIDQMQVDRFEGHEATEEIIFQIIPRGQTRWRISVHQHKRFAMGGWKNYILWTGGGQDDDPVAFLEALQAAIRIRDELRMAHPDGSLDPAR